MSMETYSANFGARCMNRAVAECSIAEAEHFTGVLRSKIQSSNDVETINDLKLVLLSMC